MMKINVKRILPILLVLMMCLIVLPGGVYADDAVIDNTKIDCSITVTKYASTSTSNKGNATGMVGAVDPSYTPLNGATFKLFKIADANKVMEYYNGTSATTYNISSFQYNERTGKATYGGTEIADGDTWEQTTTGSGSDAGKCTFTGLPVGIYVLKEVTAPSQIAAPLADPCLISVPMVNTQYTGGGGSSNNDNKKWMYDVYVYPKNHESTGTVELTKVQQDGSTPLKGVTFELFKLNNDSTWEIVSHTPNNSGTTDPLTLITDANGKIKLQNLPSGLNGTQYKLVEISAPNGYIVNKTPLYFKVNTDNTITWNSTTGETYTNKNEGVLDAVQKVGDSTTLQIKLRNERPSLNKKVFNNEINFSDATNVSANWKQNEEYRLDDTITYSLIAYVPHNVSEITYEINDIPGSGINDSQDWNDYTVTYAADENSLIDGSADTKLTLNTDYSLVSASEAGKGLGFKLSLTVAGKTATKGKFIQIVYKAHMNANAKIADDGNGNTATLTYSKFIGGGTGDYTITDEARVFTYQYQITKRKDTDTGDLIPGVQFELLNASKNNMSVIALTNPGVYRLALAGETGSTTLTTANDGTILIKGLENGTYYLKETKTINGYNLLSEPFKIDLSVTETTNWTSGTGFTTTGKVVKTYGSTGYNVTDAKGTSTIINKKGFVLPQTGGMGYLLFCTVGILLIGGGAALIFGGRRKKIR